MLQRRFNRSFQIFKHGLSGLWCNLACILVFVLLLIDISPGTAEIDHPGYEKSNFDVRREELEQQLEKDLKTGRLVKRVVSKPEPCTELAEVGDSVQVLYTGYFTDGSVFDSSHGKKPISFTIGKAQVIPGWEEGVTGMCLGEKRRLLVPPHLGYGDTGFPPVIPPQTTLLFEVNLVKLHKAESDTAHTLHQLAYWLQLATPPALGLAFLFWIQARYKQEVGKAKEEKGSRSRKKR